MPDAGELDNLNRDMRELDLETEENTNRTGRSVRIFVQDEEGEGLSADEVPPRPTSAEVLARVLGSRPNLNLTGKINIAKDAVKTKHGGAADVFEGKLIANGMRVAVKRLRLNIGGSEKIAKDIAREIRVWSELRHPNILPILGYCIEGDYPSLISAWMTHGSLRDYMLKLDKESSVKMILGIARGLAYIHSKKAIHSDVKSDNVLVSHEKEALLSDFGISRMDALSAGFTTHSVKGSTRWQAQEFFEIPDDDSPAPTHTIQTDIWAFGMTVYEVLTHEVPYYHVSDNTQVVNYISRRRLPKQPAFSRNPDDAKIDRYLWTICERCWKFDPESRPTMAFLEEEIENMSFS